MSFPDDFGLNDVKLTILQTLDIAKQGGIDATINDLALRTLLSHETTHPSDAIEKAKKALEDFKDRKISSLSVDELASIKKTVEAIAGKSHRVSISLFPERKKTSSTADDSNTLTISLQNSSVKDVKANISEMKKHLPKAQIAPMTASLSKDLKDLSTRFDSELEKTTDGVLEQFLLDNIDSPRMRFLTIDLEGKEYRLDNPDDIALFLQKAKEIAKSVSSDKQVQQKFLNALLSAASQTFLNAHMRPHSDYASQTLDALNDSNSSIKPEKKPGPSKMKIDIDRKSKSFNLSLNVNVDLRPKTLFKENLIDQGEKALENLDLSYAARLNFRSSFKIRIDDASKKASCELISRPIISVTQNQSVTGSAR